MDKLTISQHFVKAALSGAAQAGHDVNLFLAKAGIQQDLLEQPKARVTAKQYAKLMQTLWLDMQDEFMGFASRRSKPGTFATMCQLVIHCHTLGPVYKKACQFYGLFETPITVNLEVNGQVAELKVHSEATLNDPHHFLQESLLVIWHRFS